MAKDKDQTLNEQEEMEEDTPVYHDISQGENQDKSSEEQPTSEEEMNP